MLESESDGCKMMCVLLMTVHCAYTHAQNGQLLLSVTQVTGRLSMPIGTVISIC